MHFPISNAFSSHSIYISTYSKIHYFDIFMHNFQLKIRKLDTYFKITLLIFIWSSSLNYNIIFARRFCAHIICCIIFHFWGSWANQLILYWDQSLNQCRIVMLHCSGKKYTLKINPTSKSSSKMPIYFLISEHNWQLFTNKADFYSSYLQDKWE